MRPRFFPTADLELEQIIESLRRAYPPSQKGRLRLDPGLLILCGIIGFVVGIFRFAWSPTVDPLGDARLNNAASADGHKSVRNLAQPTPISIGDATPEPVYVGQWLLVHMPDGRHVPAHVVGQHEQWKDPPWNGNTIGDARYVWAQKAYFVWLTPLKGGSPTWIDP
jgi:hypothetical protein